MKNLSLLLLAGLITSCSVTLPVTATSNPIGTKHGESKAKRIFGIWYRGDASIETAARNGGISKISTVDETIRHGIFGTTIRTTVTGE